MYQKLDFALGFFITVVFLASVVVALTMIYISRSKPKIQEEKNVSEVETVKTYKLEEKGNLTGESNGPDPKESSADFKTESYINLFKKFFRVSLSSKPTSEVNIPLAEAKFPETSVVEPVKSAGGKIPDIQKEGSNSGGVSNEKLKVSKLDPLSEGEQIQQISVKNSSTSIVNTLNSSIKPDATISSTSAMVEKKTYEVTDIQPDHVKQPENKEILPVSVINVGNENEVKEPMVNESQENRPQNQKPDMGFSELFTEDTEESEASKLVKELHDVDTNDILEMSQSLVGQFKRRNSFPNGERDRESIH
jgi:hypothetical protein